MPNDHTAAQQSPCIPACRTGVSKPDTLAALKPHNGLVLYYPGAGTDYGPLQHFALHFDLAVAVYIDYLIESESIEDMIFNMLHRMDDSELPSLQSVSPCDLSCRAWADFWPEPESSRMFAKPSRAFGVQCDLQIHPYRKTRLIYLATEGHQTFGQLLGTALQPDLVVLQDHGFGGNWCDFGGESPMYRMAQTTGTLPHWLFSAGENTRPWPGYEAIGEPLLLAGQMHKYHRALYQQCAGGHGHESDRSYAGGVWY